MILDYPCLHVGLLVIHVFMWVFSRQRAARKKILSCLTKRGGMSSAPTVNLKSLMNRSSLKTRTYAVPVSPAADRTT
eukprot:4882924-Amphidinium_carterae.1